MNSSNPSPHSITQPFIQLSHPQHLNLQQHPQYGWSRTVDPTSVQPSLEPSGQGASNNMNSIPIPFHPQASSRFDPGPTQPTPGPSPIQGVANNNPNSVQVQYQFSSTQSTASSSRNMADPSNSAIIPLSTASYIATKRNPLGPSNSPTLNFVSCKSKVSFILH